MSPSPDKHTADALFNAAMRGPGSKAIVATSTPGLGGKPPTASATRPPAPKELKPTEIELGLIDPPILQPLAIDLVKLMDGRLLLQGLSGAGKSWTLRRLLEQSAGRIQQIVVDPEGEFKGLAETLGHLYVDASLFTDAHGSISGAALSELGSRVRRHRRSLVLDLSQQTREEQMIAVAAFFRALIDAPREDWHPALIAVDEAQLFAPFGGASSAADSVRKHAIAAVVDLMSRGRKRGLAGVLATLRIARLSKSVISEISNFLIGMNTLDLDIRRAAENIGWTARTASDRLPLLQPGQFIACGPAFSASPASATIGAVRSKHVGATPDLAPPLELDNESASKLLDIDGLAAQVAAAAPDNTKPAYRAVRQFIREPEFNLAARIFAELREVHTENPGHGAGLREIASHLNVNPADVAAAIELLDKFGVVEVNEGAARIAHKFLG